MHAMIAIALMVELASVAMGATFGAAGHEGIAAIGGLHLRDRRDHRGARRRRLPRGPRTSRCATSSSGARRPKRARRSMRGRSAAPRFSRLPAQRSARPLAGAALLYLDALHHWPELARGIDDARRHLAEAPDARNAFYVIAVFLVPAGRGIPVSAASSTARSIANGAGGTRSLARRRSSQSTIP